MHGAGGGRGRPAALPAVRPARSTRKGTCAPGLNGHRAAGRSDAPAARATSRSRAACPWSSNGTFLVELCLDGHDGAGGLQARARRARACGTSRPGSIVREMAAYALSEALGWGLVPETVSATGPFGEGSLQRFVAADFEQHYFTLLRGRRARTTRCGRSAPSTCWPTTPTARAGTACSDERRPHLGHRPRPLLPRRPEAAHGDLGLRRRARARRCSWPAVARFAVAPPVASSPASSTTTSSRRSSRRAGALVRRPVFPRHHSGYAYPWPVV